MDAVGVYTYFIAGVFFSFLLFLLITTGLKTLNSKILFGAIAASVFWSFHVFISIKYNVPTYFTFLSELVKNTFWGLLCLSLLTKSDNIFELFKFNHRLSWYYIVPFTAAVVDIAFILKLNNDTVWLFFAQLIQAIALLIMVEFLYRQGSSSFRWGFKPIAVFIAAIALIDMILYSTAVLLRGIDFNLFYLRATLHLLLAPVLLVGIKRFKSLGVRIFISREVVFHSTILLGISLYLTLMAATGYYLNLVGGQWSIYAQLTFICLALTIFVALFINERLRRKIKVFISKHFFANRYDYRQQWITLNKCVAKPPSDNFYHTALFAIIQLFDIEQGILIKAKNSQQALANINYQQDLSPWLEFITKYQHQNSKWIIDLDEYERFPDVYPSHLHGLDQLIGRPLKIIVPIYSNHIIYGYFILARPSHKELLNYEDRDLLMTASQQLAGYLALNEASIKISETKQFDTFNQMSAFLVHDLKNVVGQLSLISSNSIKHKDNPEFIADTFDTVANSVNKINKMLNQLRKKNVNNHSDSSVNITQLLIEIRQSYSLRISHLTIIPDIKLLIDSDKLSNVLCHLIQNSLEATGKNDKVELHLKQYDSNCSVSVIDTGCGMSDEFIRTRLFKPFDTTKGNAGMGIGAYEAKHFIESIDGEIVVNSRINQGTSIILTIPMVSNYG